MNNLKEKYEVRFRYNRKDYSTGEFYSNFDVAFQRAIEEQNSSKSKEYRYYVLNHEYNDISEVIK